MKPVKKANQQESLIIYLTATLENRQIAETCMLKDYE